MNEQQLESLLQQMKDDVPQIRTEVVTRTMNKITNRTIKLFGITALIVNMCMILAFSYWLLYSFNIKTLLEAGLILYSVLSVTSIVGLILVWDRLIAFFKQLEGIKNSRGNIYER